MPDSIGLFFFLVTECVYVFVCLAGCCCSCEGLYTNVLGISAKTNVVHYNIPAI